MHAIPNVGGRDIATILEPQSERRQPLPGFDPDYCDLGDHILRCRSTVLTHETLPCCFWSLPASVARNRWSAGWTAVVFR